MLLLMFFMLYTTTIANNVPSIYPHLLNYQINAKAATTTQYPWVAQLVHSKSNNYPVICNAVCVDKGVFITAAKCILSLRIAYTSILYKSKRLPVRAFVLPSKPTSQSFDDIGFIVIAGMTNETYNFLQITNAKRTDTKFNWLKAKNILGAKYKVVGYAAKKAEHKFKRPETVYSLTELSVVIGIDLCAELFRPFQLYNVPCYHSCTVQQFRKNDKLCNSYHGVAGGAVVDITNNKLFALATWGVLTVTPELPVGMSVLNSQAFADDFKCAKKIRNPDAGRLKSGNYQKYCP